MTPLTRDDMAKRLNVSKRHLVRLLDTDPRAPQEIVLSPRVIRYDPEAFEAWRKALIRPRPMSRQSLPPSHCNMPQADPVACGRPSGPRPAPAAA